MSQVQEIIVYRSPMEMQMYQAMQDANALPVFAAIFAFFFTFVALNILAGFIGFNSNIRQYRRNDKKKFHFNPQYVYLVIATAAALFVGNALWI